MKTKISARKFLSKYMIYLAFVALLIVFSLTLRNVGNGFLDMGNVWKIINRRKKTGRERSRPVEYLVIYKVKAIKI